MSANDIFAIPYRKGDESVLVVFLTPPPLKRSDSQATHTLTGHVNA